MSSAVDRAWDVYAMAGKALAEAEQRQRWKTHPANHPDVNRRLAEAVERARRAFDQATAELAKLTRFEA